jgi:hypothetical protein
VSPGNGHDAASEHRFAGQLGDGVDAEAGDLLCRSEPFLGVTNVQGLSQRLHLRTSNNRCAVWR